MNKSEIRVRRRVAFLTAGILAIVLFGAGLFSGLYVSKTVEQRQKIDLTRVELQQQQEIEYLVDYVNNLEGDLQNFQLQEIFINSLSRRDACELAETYFSQTAANLDYYWRVLPSRLEEYEREGNTDEEYEAVKKQYTKLSLRAWLISRNNDRQCETNIIPLLYFYSADCTDCTHQGEELDRLRDNMSAENKTVIAFTLDSNAPEPAVALIKQYYNVTETPAIIAREKVLQGRVYTDSELRRALGE